MLGSKDRNLHTLRTDLRQTRVIGITWEVISHTVVTKLLKKLSSYLVKLFDFHPTHVSHGDTKVPAFCCCKISREISWEETEAFDFRRNLKNFSFSSNVIFGKFVLRRLKASRLINLILTPGGHGKRSNVYSERFQLIGFKMSVNIKDRLLKSCTFVNESCLELCFLFWDFSHEFDHWMND